MREFHAGSDADYKTILNKGIGPEFDSNTSGHKTTGVEDAKSFPLANMNPPIGFIKIDNLLRENFNRKLDQNEYINQMTTLMVDKARGDVATDTGVYLQ